jgi:hypothetical protein
VFYWQSFAQFYSTGSDPSHLKWREIKTERYYIIYPSEIDSLARRYSLLLERSADAINQPLRSKPRKLPVVLHPHNVYSNGMVTWANGVVYNASIVRGIFNELGETTCTSRGEACSSNDNV